MFVLCQLVLANQFDQNENIKYFRLDILIIVTILYLHCVISLFINRKTLLKSKSLLKYTYQAKFPHKYVDFSAQQKGPNLYQLITFALNTIVKCYT